MTTQTYRIKYKIDEKEFELEGDKEFTEKWFEKLKKLLEPKPAVY